VEYSRVIGHGMNAAELARNRQLTDFFVRDLNAAPDGWSLGDSSVDAVVCCVSVQYLAQPERVLSEVARVLKPGGVCIFTFSNRMFFTKAIGAWRETTDYGRCRLVQSYFSAVSGFTPAEILKDVPPPAGGAAAAGPGGLDGLLAAFRKLLGGASDPFFAVVAYKERSG